MVRRLPRYYAHVQSLRAGGIEWISSKSLAEHLELTSSTVRQDLSHLDFSGISKRGYSTQVMEQTLAQLLGADEEIRLVIVGAGNLGRALALHGEFTLGGFRICGIFDSDPKVVGRKVGRLEIRAMDDLPSVVQGERVQIGVIAVPAASGQEVADRLILSGVLGLLNLAFTHILSPKTVPVIDVRILASLRELCYAIRASGPLRGIAAGLRSPG